MAIFLILRQIKKKSLRRKHEDQRKESKPTHSTP